MNLTQYLVSLTVLWPSVGLIVALTLDSAVYGFPFGTLFRTEVWIFYIFLFIWLALYSHDFKNCLKKQHVTYMIPRSLLQWIDVLLLSIHESNRIGTLNLRWRSNFTVYSREKFLAFKCWFQSSATSHAMMIYVKSARYYVETIYFNIGYVCHILLTMEYPSCLIFHCIYLSSFTCVTCRLIVHVANVCCL